MLDPRERQSLVEVMLAHVVEAASAAELISRVFLVGPTRHSLPVSLPLLSDPGRGLNPAVQSALAEIASNGPNRVIVVAADLPTLTSEDLNLLADVPASTIAIAPDRHGTGTNAISLPMPAGEGFSFAFGPDSFARHRDEALRIGLTVEIVRTPGLERDIDEPADLPDAGEVLRQEG